VIGERLTAVGLAESGDSYRLISNEGTKTLTGFFATFYARGIFGNSALLKLALVLSANFGGLLRPVHPHLFRHQMIAYLTWDLSGTQIQPDLCHESKKSLEVYQHLSLDAVEQAYEAVQGVSI
jgi:integrase